MLQVYDMWQLGLSTVNSQPYRVEASVNGVPLMMELDTGASVSVMAEETFRRQFPHLELNLSSVLLKTYSGELPSVQGSLTATVTLENHENHGVLYVVPGSCPFLLG